MKTLKSISAALLISVSAYAQKLPDKQQGSVLAPANIKIDGKTTEWSDKFQAYNDASRIYYTISNDDNNLYLTARMNDERGNRKALSGGITLTLGPAGKNIKSKNAKNIAVTYPVIINTASKLGGPLPLGAIIRDSPLSYKKLKAEKANPNELNAFIAKTNKQLETHFKEIQVLGVKEIQEPLIPVYNTDNIKAIILFNDKMEYTYELAIPLKIIAANLGDIEKLSYNIKLNARSIIKNGAPPMVTYIGNDLEILYENQPSDFSAEYTLAK